MAVKKKASAARRPVTNTVLKKTVKSTLYSPKTGLDQWMEYLIFALVILMPLIFSRVTFDQFDIIKLAVFRLITLAILILWLAKIFTAKKAEISWTRLDFLLAAFLVLVFISTIASIHPFTSFQGKYKRYEGFYTFINYGIIYFLALQIFIDRRQLNRLARTISVTATAVAVYGLVQYFGLDPINWGATPFEARSSFSTFGNPDLLGAYLALTIPVTLGSFLSSKKLGDSVFFGASYLLVAGSLLTTYTRGAWLGAIVGFFVYLFIIGFKNIKVYYEKLLIVHLIFLIFFAGILIYSSSAGPGVMNLAGRITSTAQLSSGTVGSRLEIWKSGLLMVQDRPLLGQGPDTFRLASEKYETLKYVKMVRGRTVADNAHNYAVQLLAGTGIPAAIIFFVFIIGVFYFSIITAKKRMKENRDGGSSEDFAVSGLIAAAVGYFIYLLSGISVVGSSATFWVVLAAIIGTTSLRRNLIAKPQSAFLINIGLALILMVPMLLAALTGTSMLIADYDFARAYFLTNSQMLNEAFAMYEKAFSLYPNGRYQGDLARLYLQLNQITSTDRAISALKKAKAAEPLEADYRVFLGNAYAMKYSQTKNSKYLQMAVDEINQVVARRPHSVTGHFLLGSYYLTQQKYKLAEKSLRKVADIDPNYPEVYSRLSQTYKLSGDSKLADYYAQKATLATPTR